MHGSVQLRGWGGCGGTEKSCLISIEGSILFVLWRILGHGGLRKRQRKWNGFPIYAMHWHRVLGGGCIRRMLLRTSQTRCHVR